MSRIADGKANAECIARQMQKNTLAGSQTACAPEALGRIQSLSAFRRTPLYRPLGALFEACSKQLGSLLEVSWSMLIL